MSLSIADVKTLLDSVAKQAENIKELGFDANTTGYDNNRTTVLAGDISVAADLATAFEDNIAAKAGWPTLFRERFNAINKNVGLDAFLLAQDERLHAHLRDILGLPVNFKGLFPSKDPNEASIVLGNVAVTGSGVGTFTSGPDTLVNKFGKSWLRLRVINQVTGVAAITATIIGTKLDGSAQSIGSITIPAASAVDFLVSIGVLAVEADHYHTVTNITFTGGTAGDDFQVETVLERSIAL
ncbi:MAG TPA: hypothetical protein ENI26_14130 [Methylophaga aminisulfidivorans]|uniref:Uncharacterized protein n=1 Tax=Methylophaga aminisulfidivorans TaxID=230105 RepID=A0A7C1W1W6_9GAMM|nr:hypothetical protein [Methylophaga aminisulfidivorans]